MIPKADREALMDVMADCVWRKESDVRHEMTPAQCRAARGLIRMTINDLSEVASVSATAIWDYELEIDEAPAADIDAMRSALEAAGVEFISDTGVNLLKAL